MPPLACSCLAAWPAAPLCAAVCSGDSHPCAVSCIPRGCVAVWCRAVAPCCQFRFVGGVGLCPFPVSAVLCCAVWFILFRAGFVCVVAGASHCGAVSLGFLWCGGAALLRGVVCCGVVLRRVVFCGAVLPCGAVLLGCAVRSPLLPVVPSPFPVVWCAGAVSCGVLRPVLCPGVLYCLVALCWLAVLCGCFGRWLLLFRFLSSFASLHTPAVFPVL